MSEFFSHYFYEFYEVTFFNCIILIYFLLIQEIDIRQVVLVCFRFVCLFLLFLYIFFVFCFEVRVIPTVIWFIIITVIWTPLLKSSPNLAITFDKTFSIDFTQLIYLVFILLDQQVAIKTLFSLFFKMYLLYYYF